MSIQVSLRTYDMREYEIPQLLSYSFCRGTGLPCDSFEIEFVLQEDMADILPDITRLTAVKDGGKYFSGVVDEYVFSITEQGKTVTVSGRSYAALLLDNQVRSAQFQTATLQDILSQYVYPTGITCGDCANFPSVAEYVVSGGSSRWQALYGFSHYAMSITPRFDGEGRLVLRGKCSGRSLTLTDTSCPVTRLEWREKRYGVVSRVFVINKSTGAEEIVTNDDFENRGGLAHRVVTVPKKTSYRAMRYTGEYQIEKSSQKERVLTLDTPGWLSVEPEDVVTLRFDRLGIDGTHRVGEVTHAMDRNGEITRIELLKMEG